MWLCTLCGMDLCALLYFSWRAELKSTRNIFWIACFMQYWIQPLAKDVANVWANKYLVFWTSSVNRLSHQKKKKMHGLNSIASCCVNYEYRYSIFLLGPQTWPTSTRLFLHCNVLLVFLLFSPSLDSGFSHGRLNWKKPVAWKGKCAMFLFRV